MSNDAAADAELSPVDMTRLCAEAMGLTSAKLKFQPRDQVWVEVSDMKHARYDPLHDDAQAMQLVERLELDITRLPGILKWMASKWISPSIQNARMGRSTTSLTAPSLSVRPRCSVPQAPRVRSMTQLRSATK